MVDKEMVFHQFYTIGQIWQLKYVSKAGLHNTLGKLPFAGQLGIMR
jgi:hypothetical protein